ncbi:hypothetical protein [Streptomyces natalensis]|uniref:Uncharacterized protein n=1 Tax=Streptomyces natalensis ATCC 27448 TaxID=1240678 RepID=A0A0D7CM68_9ACTN|nr:hypothetical protein [Streptomyces natalensis]KIZ17304.1 hypothetical protein SNA_14855 [Streptomyces natalensis ATCC 27448]
MRRRTREELTMVRNAVIADMETIIWRYRQGDSMSDINHDYWSPGEHWLARKFDEWGEPRRKAIPRVHRAR